MDFLQTKLIEKTGPMIDRLAHHLKPGVLHPRQSNTTVSNALFIGDHTIEPDSRLHVVLAQSCAIPLRHSNWLILLTLAKAAHKTITDPRTTKAWVDRDQIDPNGNAARYIYTLNAQFQDFGLGYITRNNKSGQYSLIYNAENIIIDESKLFQMQPSDARIYEILKPPDPATQTSTQNTA